MITPTVGRIVYYKSRGSADGKFPKTDRAAIVTDVRHVSGNSVKSPYQVRLTVFNPVGLFFTDWLWQGQDGGDWDWMPFQKDQAARMAPGTLNESHPPAVSIGPVTAITEPSADTSENIKDNPA